MKEFKIGVLPIIIICITVFLSVKACKEDPYIEKDLIRFSKILNKSRNDLKANEQIIMGLQDQIIELRDITDEFRAQIKGLQKEVLIGIQEGGM